MTLPVSLLFFRSVSLSVFPPVSLLPQKVTRQQQEINSLPQKRMTVDGDLALMKKELTSLREQLVNKSRELQVDGVSFLQLCGSLSFQVSFLRSTRCNQAFSHFLLPWPLLESENSCFTILNTISQNLSHPVLLSCHLKQRFFSLLQCLCEKGRNGGRGKLVVNLQINT